MVDGDGWVIFFRFFKTLFRVFDSSGDFASFSFSLFDSFESFGVDIDVEADSIFISEVFTEIFSSSDVIDDEIFTSFFRSEVDSSYVSIVKLDWVNVDLEDVLVDLLECLEQLVFKNFFCLGFVGLLQTRCVE